MQRGAAIIVMMVLASTSSLASARLECGMGWGQFNDDNIRLRIEKTWTRICLSYCFELHTSDPSKMAALVGGDWDEQQFYRRFGIKGCGGMLGTAVHIGNEESCAEGTIDVTRDWRGRALGAPVSMDITCCDRQAGCTTTTSGAAAARTSSSLLGSWATAASLLLLVTFWRR